ncbi:hypothetical protein QBC44DRAFT_337184 [Cladorrhinum sp. PSN332]|nr:hypothetical protein QBC44DRAFT_337184 [Cladorrhinum sp. PSN332]
MLTSKTTGPNGMVIPPLRVMEWEKDAAWPVKESPTGEDEHIFCHGNLHAHCIMMHVETLYTSELYKPSVKERCGRKFPPKFSTCV